MKKFALALAAVLILVMACGDMVTPDQVVKKVLNALDSKDGDAIAACMSEEALEDMIDALEEIKENPEESAAVFTASGVDISAEEIEYMTVGDLISAILNSEVLSTEMPDFRNVVVGETLIDGDDAMVFVTIDGDQKEFELVLENGNWKIDDGINFI